MVGALPRAEPLEPRAPRREPELGAELRGPVAVASVVPVAETGDFRYTTELPKESRPESGDSNHPKTWSHMSGISGHSMGRISVFFSILSNDLRSSIRSDMRGSHVLHPPFASFRANVGRIQMRTAPISAIATSTTSKLLLIYADNSKILHFCTNTGGHMMVDNGTIRSGREDIHTLRRKSHKGGARHCRRSSRRLGHLRCHVFAVVASIGLSCATPEMAAGCCGLTDTSCQQV